MNDDLRNFLSSYPLEIQSIILGLQKLILVVYPTALEQVDLPSKIIGYGRDRTYKGMVCAIAPQRKYVNLMFARGTELEDPEQLLEGTGKRARHTKIRSAADVDRPAVHNLLKEAIELINGEPNE
jgi:hypothetical protein